MAPQNVDDVVVMEACQHRAPHVRGSGREIPCRGLMAGSQTLKEAISWLTRAVRHPLRSHNTDGTRWGTMNYWTWNDGYVNRSRSE